MTNEETELAKSQAKTILDNVYELINAISPETAELSPKATLKLKDIIDSINVALDISDDTDDLADEPPETS